MVIITSLLFIFITSCNDQSSNAKAVAGDAFVQNTSASQAANQKIIPEDTVSTNETTSNDNGNTDSISSQLKNISSMFGKNDSDILQNIAGGGNMDSMISKLQSMAGGKSGNPGDAISAALLNQELGGMKDDNPLKSVAKGMIDAEKNGTASPAKVYTASYVDEQPNNFEIPTAGNGNTIMLKYSGGSIENGKKDGLWKNIYINTTKSNGWNIYTEGYAESSAINMKVHSTSLASIHEDYSINLNDQYKKYSNQPMSDLGKNEFDVQVQKIGSEKLFGYNCVHIKITYILKALKQTVHEQNDEWYSSDVEGSKFLLPQIFENHSRAVVKKISDAGCSGVLVKSITKSSGAFQLIQLSSIINKDMPDSTFNLPTNYQEDKNTVLYDIQ